MGFTCSHFTSAEQGLDGGVFSLPRLLFPPTTDQPPAPPPPPPPSPEGYETIYQLPEEHVSMCSTAWEFSFYYTLNCKVNLAGIRVKAVKRTNMKQIAHAEDAV